ncbi:endonuclease domain-containing protein [Devosia beringensis]|uniref:endonuclease domain-containing protein n=1 Tax=Devosia beringensis TaxID=2657486 RepID=UPI00186B5EA0|nr:endonuclease domain-containing protein [Devosia beringensis]
MKEQISFACGLRREQTVAERRFWALLEPWRRAGWHMRRQAPIGPYVVDFVCKRAGIIFEIDGDSHFTEAGLAHDARRTAFLVGLGYRVVRFGNDDVLDNADGVGEVVFGLLGPVDGEPPGWGTPPNCDTPT